MIFVGLSVIAIKILEMNGLPQVKEAAASVLKRYREILKVWFGKLEELMNKSDNQKDWSTLKNYLLKVANSGAFTFNVSTQENISYVLKEPSDIIFFLEVLAKLHYLVIRENVLNQSPPSNFVQNLLRHSRLTIPLRLQSYMYLILENNAFNCALHEFTCSRWHNAQFVPTNGIPIFEHSGNYSALKRHAYQANYQTSTGSHLVCLDLLRGTFYVDGYPPSVLPETIARNPLFTSYFKTSAFRVQRDSRTFTTVDKYHGLHFDFTQSKFGLVIRELSRDKHWFELVPKHLIQDHLAADFIDKYTHWYDSKTNALRFHRSPLHESTENLEQHTEFLLAPVSCQNGIFSKKWRLQKCYGVQTASNCYLLSIKSVGFEIIADNMKNLEQGNFIHAQLQMADFGVTANLWRLNLSFQLKPNGFFYSNNYPGYYIPPSNDGSQNLGTLVGLQSGIVLEKRTDAEANGKMKKFIVQHGQVQISHSQECLHQRVVVTTPNAPQNPPFFVYEVDCTLKRLRAGNSKSAWFYLALLHGATAAPFVDPFTELTGTEMAIWILQSGFSWSCSPFDSECKSILSQIAALSPQYTYYPSYLKVMQTTEWPTGLLRNSYAAYDGYALIVDKLLRDSSSLKELFPSENCGKSSSGEPSINDLYLRSYYKHLNWYNKAAHLSVSSEIVYDSRQLVDFTTVKNLPTRLRPSNDTSSAEMATLAELRMNQATTCSKEKVARLIMTRGELPHNLNDQLTSESLGTWFSTKLRENWLQLYSLCTRNDVGSSVEHELTMILGAMLYSGEGTFGQLVNLHSISVARRELPFPEAPISLTGSSFSPLNNEFINSDIIRLLKGAVQPAPRSIDYLTYSRYQEAEREFQSSVNRQANSCVQDLKREWPTGRIDFHTFREAVGYHQPIRFSPGNLFQLVNKQLNDWYNNHCLQIFINKVDENLSTLPDASEKIRNAHIERHLSFRPVPDIVDPWFSNENFAFVETQDIANLAQQIFNTGRLEGVVDFKSKFVEQRKSSIDIVHKLMQDLVAGQQAPGEDFALTLAGLHLRVKAPVILLRASILQNCDFKGNVRNYIGALAVLWTFVKRLNRLIMFSSDKVKYSVELERERETIACGNWCPSVDTSWLLLELELDITIRPVQVDVARRMIRMPSGGNGVMQLNMGEGKTSVIIPMIVSALSSDQKQLCRVTVLNSIFATNYKLLAFAVGGFLNKRVYTVPCSRDMSIEPYLSKIQQHYNDCLRFGGTVITVPEHRLSFRLQMYNNFLQAGKEVVGQKIYKIESWLRANVRDLVDESDEIFSVKYQLIYTTGVQLNIDGGNMRWRVCQKLLELLCHIAPQVYHEFGSKVVEYQIKEAQEHSEKFPHFRIVDERCKNKLHELMVDGILDGKVSLIGSILSMEERNIVREFLTNDDISEEHHNKLFSIGLPEETRMVLLLISGYLRRGILFTALKKRWRVEYGVKLPKKGSIAKLLAVPFRAKDVAAERTEFGHPDMAIVLTQLSYYYSGLNDDQLLQCFHILDNNITSPASIYCSWLTAIPPHKIKINTIKSYTSINLQDYEQRNYYLFPVLRHHKSVIDFWLENVVFPKESKQFPGKLVTNAWDLCYERFSNPTTGFSGTNDTSLLLPAQISQQDLPELTETNKEMEEILMRGENCWRRSLSVGVTCKEVLQLMAEDGLRVLIDAGALMLQLDNEKIAELWLTLDESLEAIVYFNEMSEMVVKVRHNDSTGVGFKSRQDTLIALSPSKDRLETCGVYLDDQHTRGTDIKLPVNFKACVTVGSRMRRDKLIQACMRMRKLGKGQSVHFYLSHEVNNKISSKAFPSISVSAILSWTKQNSNLFQKDGLSYWTANARSYAKNLAADDLFELSGKSMQDGARLGKQCEDPDARTLQLMYGTFHHKNLVTDWVPRCFEGIKRQLMADNLTFELPTIVTDSLRAIEATVLDKCRRHIPNAVFLHNMLEEEQEKELEPEQEMEEEKYRPNAETPLDPFLHPNVKQCIISESYLTCREGIGKLCQMFCGTNLSSIVQPNAWGDQWFATEDFIKTIENASNSQRGQEMDCFIRPIRYFVSFSGHRQNTRQILVLSLYEVNALINVFRENACGSATTLHMFSARCMDGQHILANDSKLQLPLSRHVSLTKQLMAPVLIAAGNLYFSSLQEQKAFAGFLGLQPRPWEQLQEQAFQAKMISKTGYVSPLCPSLREGCDFNEDPSVMVMGILKIRNEVLRETDHVVAILERCAYLLPNRTEEETSSHND